MNAFSIIYFFIVYFTYAISKYSASFEVLYFSLSLGDNAVPVFVTVVVSLASMCVTIIT